MATKTTFSTITVTPVTAGPRVYPHVSEIIDPKAQMSTRLVWDRVHDLEERLTAAQTTITKLVNGHNANQTAITTAQTSADSALAISQQASAAPAGSTGVGGDTGPSPGNFPQPFDSVKNPNPPLGRTASYVQQMIHQAFLAFEAAHPGRQPEANEQYWYKQFLTKNTLDPNGAGDGWGAYWWDRIQTSPSVPL